mgnify:CR=1 FL=1
MKHKIGFIGLGLIGGSIAKAIRQYYPDYEIVAFDKNKESLALATQESVIDVAATTIDNNFQNCNYIFLCAPVAYNTAYLKQLTEYLNDDCILTDVGSVKTNIHEEVQNLGIGKYFIGGHPMAGSEKSGYSNSKAMLIENAYYILTPTPQVAEEKVQTYEKFVESLKALPVILDYQLHDQITGTISHLPHIIASSLVNFVKTHDTHDEMMKNLAAGGFKDITRIASSSPVMWENICLSNQEQILKLLDNYIHTLEVMRTNIADADSPALLDAFTAAKDYRDSITITAKGALKNVYELYLDLIDETGGIATVATILASNNLSIKNIGIIHNREFEGGVLRLEMYDGESLALAVALLKKHHYTIYER